VIRFITIVELSRCAPGRAASDTGQAALQSALTRLPRWVLPLLILDRPDNRRTRELAEHVRDVLRDAGALSTDASRRAARGVSSLGEFIAIVPVLVAEAERQYLKNRGEGYGRGEQTMAPVTSRRPSLCSQPRSDGSISPPDRLGETPDA